MHLPKIHDHKKLTNFFSFVSPDFWWYMHKHLLAFLGCILQYMQPEKTEF